MKLKKVNEDPFSNGTEHLMFEAKCCDRCLKSSEPKDDGIGYTNAGPDNMPRCSIQRDIVIRAILNEPIKQETIDVCNNFIFHGTLCPYMKTERKKYKKKDPINQQKLNL